MHLLPAMILQEVGRTNEAAVALKRVLYLDPDQVLAHFTLGTLLHQKGDLEASARHLDIALNLLRSRPRDEVLDEADGITAGRLCVLIEAMTAPGKGEE